MSQIKQNEIRIGNLVNHEIFGIVEIFSIYKTSFDISRNGKSKEWFIGVDSCSPIPITEEILLEFGFEKDSIFLWKSISIRSYLKIYKPYQLVKSPYYHINILDKAVIEIKYVHHLQNIVFDLFGEELKRIEK